MKNSLITTEKGLLYKSFLYLIVTYCSLCLISCKTIKDVSKSKISTTTICKTCNGTGQISFCPKCGGTGSVLPNPKGGPDWSVGICPLCHGRKHLEQAIKACPTCHGTGTTSKDSM